MKSEPLLELLTKANLEELQEFVNSNGKSKAYSPIEIIGEKDKDESEVTEDNA